MLKKLVDQIDAIIIGKREQVELCVVCLLADGHLLIEDMPGVGKTTLAQALSKSIGMRFSRVQFTSDLMPSDLLGVSIYERSQEGFVFHPGPVFSQVLLADEINRAGPRTQSALLEAMEERQISIDGKTHRLPEPFFVIATQNPIDQLGTHPLPESQLDRFALRIALGYPDAAAERLLLKGMDRKQLLSSMAPVFTPQEWLAQQTKINTIHVSDALLDYVQALLQTSRQGQWRTHGISPRAALVLLRLARARALLHGRKHVSPEDIRVLWVPAMAHRLQAGQGTATDGVDVAQRVLHAVAAP
jgi:MoxR-like ATPase